MLQYHCEHVHNGVLEAITIPKIIENLRETLLAEAKRQLCEWGYDAVTIRSIAHGCRVGLGTVYNYFPSKDALIAETILGDWLQTVEDMRENLSGGFDRKTVLKTVFEGFRGFYTAYRHLFSNDYAYLAYRSAASDYHSKLCKQIESLLCEYIPLLAEKEDPFLTQFVAESMISCGQRKVEFEKLYGVLDTIIE